MSKLGFYDGPLDGWFGSATEAAVVEYQGTVGLVADGVVGSLTKTHMTAPLHDGISHKSASADARPDAFVPGSTVKFFVGRSPGYLLDDVVLAVISEALAHWAEATTLVFTHTTSDVYAGIKFYFGLPDNASNMLRFDGPGGELARAEDGCVYFDTAERYCNCVVVRDNSRHCFVWSLYDILT